MILRLYFFLGNVLIWFGLFMFLVQPVFRVFLGDTYLLIFNPGMSIPAAILGALIRIEQAIRWYRENTVSDQ